MIYRSKVSRACGLASAVVASVLIFMPLACMLSDEAPAASDPFLAVNQAFHEAYESSRDRVLKQALPIIVVDGDHLSLETTHRTETIRVIPREYHDLKSVAHAVLATFLLAETSSELRIDVRIVAARTLREKIERLNNALDERGFCNATLLRQQNLLGGSLALLSRLEDADAVVRGDDATSFARSQAPALLSNAEQSARIQIDAVNAQVAKWKRSLSEAEWTKIRVLIVGGTLSRKGNVATQIFSWWLNESGEGPRIIYVERSAVERAHQVLGTHLMDSRIGFAFFADPSRMSRDLLSDAATAYLKTLPRSLAR